MPLHQRAKSARCAVRQAASSVRCVKRPSTAAPPTSGTTGRCTRRHARRHTAHRHSPYLGPSAPGGPPSCSNHGPAVQAAPGGLPAARIMAQLCRPVIPGCIGTHLHSPLSTQARPGPTQSIPADPTKPTKPTKPTEYPSQSQLNPPSPPKRDSYRSSQNPSNMGDQKSGAVYPTQGLLAILH